MRDEHEIDDAIELGAASALTQAIGNHSVEPSMEPLVWI